MKVIVTGTTGMVGKAVLLECLGHADVSEVLSISRRKLGMEHPKLKELLHEDFAEFGSVSAQLSGYDACYACMGVSSAGIKEQQFTKLTYDYTLALAKVLQPLNPGMTFTYVSGQGTDSTEKGKLMWARVKGKTENDIIKLGFKQAFMFRPGGIIPQDGVWPSSKFYSVLLRYFKWLLYIIKALAPNSIINSKQLGLAMINATLYGCETQVLNPRDIIAVAQKTN